MRYKQIADIRYEPSSKQLGEGGDVPNIIICRNGKVRYNTELRM